MKTIKRPPMVERLKARLKTNPNINLSDFNIPLSNGLPTPKLKDVLVENVDEKYYLRHDVVEKIIAETDFRERLVSININKDED
jgi:hypothetical protein